MDLYAEVYIDNGDNNMSRLSFLQVLYAQPPPYGVPPQQPYGAPAPQPYGPPPMYGPPPQPYGIPPPGPYGAPPIFYGPPPPPMMNARSPAVAAVLNFILWGLGYCYIGGSPWLGLGIVLIIVEFVLMGALFFIMCLTYGLVPLLIGILLAWHASEVAKRRNMGMA